MRLGCLAGRGSRFGTIGAVSETDLQHRIETDARATVTSVASIGAEFVAFAVYGLWVLGSALAIGVLILVVALVIWRRQ